MPISSAHASSRHRLLHLAIALLVIGLPWAFFGYMAGDAVIHLIFAENALHGDWLAFNPGERSGGETSFGYMLVVMGLWHLVGQAWVPYAMIAICYAAWLAMLACGWKLVDDWYPRSEWPWLWLLITGTMPGSVFNSVLGMENVLLAPAAMGLVWAAYRWNALAQSFSPAVELAIASGLGLLTWLRPEALFLAAGLLAWRMFTQWRTAGGTGSLIRGCISGGIVVAWFAGLCALLVWLSGLMPFSGGVARLNMSASDGVLLGGVVPLHTKMASRIVAYFPLTALFALGVHRWTAGSSSAPVHRGTVGLAIVLVSMFAALYSTILPTAHLARYTIFLWPLVTLVATYGVAESWPDWRARLSPLGAQALLTGVLVALAAIYGYEFRLRHAMLAGQHPLPAVRDARANRPAATDALIHELQADGPFPVSVGFIEVQMRYFFDDRIVVRTMDGIVDNRFNSFVHRTPDGVAYDYTGFFKHVGLDYIAEYLDLNPTADDWSPAVLERMPAGSIDTHDGVRFQRLTGRMTRLTYPDQDSGEPPSGRSPTR
jgi:hypothetical protein